MDVEEKKKKKKRKEKRKQNKENLWSLKANECTHSVRDFSRRIEGYLSNCKIVKHLGAKLRNISMLYKSKWQTEVASIFNNNNNNCNLNEEHVTNIIKRPSCVSYEYFALILLKSK